KNSKPSSLRYGRNPTNGFSGKVPGAEPLSSDESTRLVDSIDRGFVSMPGLLSSIQHWAKVFRIADVATVKLVDGKERQIEHAGRPALPRRCIVNATCFQLDSRGDCNVHRHCQTSPHPLLANVAEDHDQLVDLLQTFLEHFHVLLRIVLFRIDVRLDALLDQKLAQL